MRVGFISLFLIACGPKTVTSIDYGAMPTLPSPTAGSYGRSPSTPADAAVAHLAGERRLDAYLSGTASGLALAMALEGGELTRREIRDAAWMAGYPYTITDARAWRVEEGAAPPAELTSWLEATPPASDLALVRARGRAGDVWVALSARPPVDLGLLPRVATLGETLRLPALAGARAIIADPEGRMTETDLTEAARIELNTDGEWVFEIWKNDARVANFPVYVGIEAPLYPLLPAGDTPLAPPAEMSALAIELLDETRDVYGVSPWERDTFLDALAQQLVAQPSLSREATLKRLGLPAGRADVWRCTARSVEDCVDHLVWSPTHRATLMSPDIGLMGIASELSGGEVRIAVVLSEG